MPTAKITFKKTVVDGNGDTFLSADEVKTVLQTIHDNSEKKCLELQTVVLQLYNIAKTLADKQWSYEHDLALEQLSKIEVTVND